jgi:hypothetical protein
MGTVATFASVLWGRLIAKLISIAFVAYAAGLVVAVASLWLFFELLESLTTRKLRKGICPSCGGSLERVGGGFYDGIMPNPWELLIYILVIAIPCGVTIVARNAG